MYEYFLDFPYNVPAMQAVRTDDWLWIEFDSDLAPELYDVHKDPHTRTNLSTSEPEVATTLAARLSALRADVAAGAVV
jgi:arylsulfatase A-like enzyme